MVVDVVVGMTVVVVTIVDSLFVAVTFSLIPLLLVILCIRS